MAVRHFEEEEDDRINVQPPPNVEVEYTIHDVIEFAQQQNQDHVEINDENNNNEKETETSENTWETN
jgi:hypothetical protein